MSAKPSKKPDWRTYRFDQIATNVNERVDDPSKAGVEYYVGLEHLDSDSLTIRRWGSPRDVEATKLRFRKGDIIFGRRRVYQRKVGVAAFDGICSAHAMVLRAKPDVALPEFLPFFMQSNMFMERAQEISVGSLSPTINWPSLAREEFALPPLDEQRRVAQVMRSCDLLRDRLTRLLESARITLHSLIGEALYTTASTIRISELCPFITSGSRGWAQYYAPEGRVFFRITNMIRGSIRPDWSDTKYVDAPNDAEAARTKVAQGDVLVSVTADLGLVTLVDEHFPDAHVNQHIAIIRPDQSRANSKFIAYFLASEAGRRQFLRLNDQGAKAGLNLNSLGALELPLLPRKRQDDLVSRLRDVDLAEVRAAARLNAIDEFRRAALRSCQDEGAR
jgi:type I restriction enzyme S subunit